MIIKIFQPPTHNWLLIADQLDDPEGWTRFVPCHTATSQRFLFETTVRESVGPIKLKACKELFARGRSVFEYDWESDENEILAHAMDIADKLQAELVISDSTSEPLSRSVA